MYELVDEDKYAQLVQDRQEEEWIVDDGTTYMFYCYFKYYQKNWRQGFIFK